MKTIYKITKTELKTLFYSPIAWLIIVIFTFQSAMIFSGIFERFVHSQSMGWSITGATASAFTKVRGLFTQVQQYLFLYIPLLTMGVMSREFSSGSIKLLYSSPLTSRQIVFGKYLALVFFSFVLTAILAVFGIYAAATIVEVDIPLILTGLLGLFLLTCAYAAIGMFMSSLTSYTVVSAMGTLATFAVLSYVKGIGQDIEFVRDITYWLAITGRSDTFISGLISSEDVIYFLAVIALFLSFTIIKINSGRQRSPFYATFGKYASVVIVVILIGYFSSMPRFKSYHDSTRTKLNTLTKSSQEVLKNLKGGLTIHTYTNLLEDNYNIALPSSYKTDVDRFTQYLRFKPEIKMKYTYYYRDSRTLDERFPDLNEQQRMDTLKKLNDYKFKIHTYDEIKGDVDLVPEQHRFVRLLTSENGKQSFLRVFEDMRRLPSESEITASFKRLTLEKLPTVGFLVGHGERKSNAADDRGYNMFAQEKTYRYSLINQGFDFEDVNLDKEVPEHIRILVIAEVRKDLTSNEIANLNRYIEKGGNLLIAGEPGRQGQMNPLVESLGVRFLTGMLVQPTAESPSDLLTLKPTQEATEFSFYFEQMVKRKQVITMPTTTALEFNPNKGFNLKTLFTSDTTGSWNELQAKNFVDDVVKLNPESGEVEQPLPTVIALSRKVNGKEQKIIVTGDADWLSNGELMMNRADVKASNYSLINGAFFWLTDEEVPIDMRRDPMPDTSLRIGEKGWGISDVALKWIFPLGLALVGALIWIRRKGR